MLLHRDGIVWTTDREKNSKLLQLWFGPFEVLKVDKSRDNYTLRLPPHMSRTHDTFHASKLKPFRQPVLIEGSEPTNSEPEAEPDEEGMDSYEVEEILDHRETRKGEYYLVRWKGYSSAYDTWEPLENVKFAQDKIKEFKARRKVSSRRKLGGVEISPKSPQRPEPLSEI